MAFVLPALPFALAEGATLLGGLGEFVGSVLAFQGASDLIDAGVNGAKYVYDELKGEDKDIKELMNKNRMAELGAGKDNMSGNTERKLILPKK